MFEFNYEAGEIAYEAYRSHTGGKSLATGQDIPVYGKLSKPIQDAWARAASAVQEYLAKEAEKK
jgi:hypothetical protein